MVTQGTSSLCLWHSLMLRRWSHPSHLSPVRPVPLWPLHFGHLNQFRAHCYRHGCSFNLSSVDTHYKPFFYRNPATCVFSLWLSDAPFTDRAVFSIQGQYTSHIFFYCNSKMLGLTTVLFLVSLLANKCSASNSLQRESSLKTCARRLLFEVIGVG